MSTATIHTLFDTMSRRWNTMAPTVAATQKKMAVRMNVTLPSTAFCNSMRNASSNVLMALIASASAMAFATEIMLITVQQMAKTLPAMAARRIMPENTWAFASFETWWAVRLPWHASTSLLVAADSPSTNICSGWSVSSLLHIFQTMMVLMSEGGIALRIWPNLLQYPVSAVAFDTTNGWKESQRPVNVFENDKVPVQLGRRELCGQGWRW